jgi:aldehyde dehydrogenase (NAD+)/betaine-aldehyde dehydrogenase
MAETMQTRGAVATLRAYAELAARDRTADLGRHEGPIPSSARVSYLPTGVVAVIAAYNIPLSIAARSMGGALAAGCTVVLLPSPRAPLTTLLMAQAAQDTGLPPGVINVVVGNADVGAALTTHRGVDKIAFTGSVSVGRQIMAQAAASLKRLSLELGGKAPTVVMPGVDLEPIIYGLHARYVRNAGQGCMTPGRILVHRDDRERFVELSRGVYAQLQAGDPWERSSVLGPLIRPDHLHRVQGMVTQALDHGATVLAEGPPPTADRGWFMSPMLLGNVAPSDPIAQREIFGPVGVLLTYDDVNQAVEIANDTDYGLSADVYGTTTESAVEVASRLRSGAVVVNGGGTPRPGVPMGGFKSSGFGRQGGEWGVREFLETQYVHWPA